MAKLYMMCGPSGSGKSTYIRNTFKGIPVVSTDAIRGLINGDENCQNNGSLIFKIAYDMVLDVLDSCIDVVFDATNLRASDRKKLLKFITNHGVEFDAVCIVMNTSYKQCIINQHKRSRVVPEEVVTRQYNNFEYPTVSEGFKNIINANYKEF